MVGLHILRCGESEVTKYVTKVDEVLASLSYTTGVYSTSAVFVYQQVGVIRVNLFINAYTYCSAIVHVKLLTRLIK